MTAYQRLESKFARIATLNEASAMLGWDAAAMMPAGGAAARGEQLSILAGLSHELLTSPAIADDLAAAGAPEDAWARSKSHPDARCASARHRFAARPGGSQLPRAERLRDDLAHRPPGLGFRLRPPGAGGGFPPHPGIRQHSQAKRSTSRPMTR